MEVPKITTVHIPHTFDHVISDYLLDKYVAWDAKEFDAYDAAYDFHATPGEGRVYLVSVVYLGIVRPDGYLARVAIGQPGLRVIANPGVDANGEVK